MGWKVSFISEHNIVETAFFGTMKKSELDDAIKATLEECASRKVLKILADCSGLQGGHSLFDLYEKINVLNEMGLDKNIREALIMPEEQLQQDKIEFWELALGNKGFTVRAFYSRKDAIDWLAGQ